ncbi:hypothetical protein Tco_0602214 [Tanacetum coccineum]
MEYVQVVSDSEEAINVIPLAVKSLIVSWKSYCKGDMGFYEIHKAEGNYKTYKFFSEMLNDFDRDDLIVLYRLFNEKYASTRPGVDDLMLLGDMKIMFDPDENGEIWKNHNSQELIEWKLYEFCGVHSLMLREVTIYMLVEKKYPLPRDTLTRMLRWKLHVNYEIPEMAYELLKFIRADGTYKTYKFFSEMLNDFDRDDLIVLYRLFNEMYASTRLGFDDLMLWGDMKIMFDPDENGYTYKNALDGNFYVELCAPEMAYELLKFIRLYVQHQRDWFSFTKRRAPSQVCIDDNLWRHPDATIDDPRPVAGSFNMTNVRCLSAHVIKLRDMLEVIGIHNFLCLPEWTDAEVQEEPYLDVRPTLQRLSFYYTPLAAADAVIPNPTLEDLVAGTP